MSDQPLRIAMISEHASPLAVLGGTDAGGQNVYVAQVSRGLARLGHHVDVLTRRDCAQLASCVDVCPGVRVLHVDAGPASAVPKEQLLPHMSAFAAAAHQLLSAPRTAPCAARPPGGSGKVAKPHFPERHSVGHDLVHANFFMSGLVGLRLKERLRLPLVMTFHALGLVRREHQQSADAFPLERVQIERRLVQRADRVIAECPQDQADLERLYGARAANLAMVPCGVDLDEFSPGPQAQARRQLGIGEHEFVVLQLGRMVPRKGVDNVIRAIAHLKRKAPHAAIRLLVVGGESAEPDERATPEIGRLSRIAAECGVEANVSFLGQRQRSELRQCYVAADVFVSTPWYEPFGITPLEAMACARPVVGSAVGGIQYSVVDEVTGLLVAPRDPEALAVQLERLRANPALAQAMGRAGARRVRERFTWGRIAGQLAQVYGEVRAEAAAADGRSATVRRLRVIGAAQAAVSDDQRVSA